MEIRVWERRNERGITLEELEKLTKISRSTLNRIENGQISPRFIHLEKIAEALDVKITDLVESEYL